MTLASLIIFLLYIAVHLLALLALAHVLWEAADGRRAGRVFAAVTVLVYGIFICIPIAAALLEESALSLTLQRVGNVFLAFDIHIVVFWLLLTPIFSLVRKVRRKRRTAPGLVAPLILAAIIGTIVPIYGMVHAQDPVLNYQTADLRTGEESGSSLRIALIADLHLSVNSHVETTEKMVERLNAAEPDLVLVAGDIFTSTYDGLREPERYSAALAGIRAPLGVYAVYGNHDVSERLFAGFAIRPVSEAFRPPEMEQFFADSGFTVLTDEHVSLLDGRFTLVGRLDESKAGDGTSNRLSVSELLADTDKDSLLLVLEHEPVEYDALWEQGVDMVFSGHTHNGQIFPGNLYVNLMNRNAYGRVTIGSMETFVTSGVGTFGPPMRTGTNSEIMIIDVMYTP